MKSELDQAIDRLSDTAVNYFSRKPNKGFAIASSDTAVPTSAVAYKNVPKLEDMNPENDMISKISITDNSNIAIPMSEDRPSVFTGTVTGNGLVASDHPMYNTVKADTYSEIDKLQKMYTDMIGKVYRHYKGHIYKVIDICINTETLKPMILYSRVDGNEDDRKIKWCRPASMFLEYVSSPDDRNAIPRFEEV